MHNHTHDHHGHSHSHSAGYYFFIAIGITLFFAGVELVGGLFAHSLALLSDAGHMAADTLALGMAALASWFAHKPASEKHTYGFGRLEIIVAWTSSIILFIIALGIMVEAIERLHAPPVVNGKLVIIIASIGLISNILVALLLARHEKTLNMRAALLHVLNDLLGSFAALTAGVIIHFTHWLPIDPLLSLVISALIAWASLRILRESILILMEGVPAHLEINTVAQEMKAVNGVLAVHDLHIWTLSSGRVALSAHVDIHDLGLWQQVLTDLNRLLKQKFKIEHITLQPEPEIIGCTPCGHVG